MNEPTTEPLTPQPQEKIFDMKYLVLFGLSLLTVIIMSLVVADYRTDKLEQEFNGKITDIESQYTDVLKQKDESISKLYDEWQTQTTEVLQLREQLNQPPVVENKVNIDQVNSAINSTVTMLQLINQTKDKMFCAGKSYSVKIQGKYYCIRRSTGGGSGSSASVS